MMMMMIIIIIIIIIIIAIVIIITLWQPTSVSSEILCFPIFHFPIFSNFLPNFAVFNTTH